MGCKVGDYMIKKGDYILITEPGEGERYLKIGEVVDIDYYSDGEIKEYTVRFGYNYDISAEDLSWYNPFYLECSCKVLNFKN